MNLNNVKYIFKCFWNMENVSETLKMWIEKVVAPESHTLRSREQSAAGVTE